MRALLNIVFIAAMVLAIACGATNPFKGSDAGLTRTSELWSDVPKMDGLSQSTLEPPFFVKLLMRTALNQIGSDRGNTGDWIVFDSSKKPDDVKNFYSNERMAASGWEKSDKSTCVSGSEYGVSQVGIVCLFVRHAADKDVGLMIIPAQGEKSGTINVWFIRVEGPNDSKATTASKAAPAKRDNDEGSSNMSSGPAPYRIDQRPMPAGNNIGQLLPEHVGPYVRERLHTPTTENLKPEEIGAAIDGSIYADYRAGSATIFVELGVMYSVKDARDALEVAVGDSGGIFPTDPRFGARGREPSYFKVVDGNGAFFAWTRGNYYFSAQAKSGEAALDAFLQSFPY